MSNQELEEIRKLIKKHSDKQQLSVDCLFIIMLTNNKHQEN